MRVYSKILDASQEQNALKPFALTDHQGGVPVDEIPEIFQVSETTAEAHTAVGATKGTFEGVQHPHYVFLQGTALDYRYDAISIEWYSVTAGQTLDRADPDTYDFIDRFTIARQDFIQDTTDDAATGLQAHVSHSQSIDNADQERGFELARNSQGHLFVAESQNSLPDWTTIKQGDAIYIRHYKYEGGIAGNIIGDIRATGAGTRFVGYVHGFANARPTTVPAAIDYRGGSGLHIPNPNNTGWIPLRTGLGTTPADHREYIARLEFVRAATGHWSRESTTIWSADRSTMYIQFSADGTSWHSAQAAGDRYVRRRLHARDTWQVEEFDPEAGQPTVAGLAQVGWQLEVATTEAQRQRTENADFDLNDYRFLLLRWFWNNSAEHAWITIPTWVVESTTEDDYDHDAGFTFSLLFTTDIMGGSASLRDARWGTGEAHRTQAFRMKLVRNAGDGIKRVRKVKLWDPVLHGVTGSGGTFYLQGIP